MDLESILLIEPFRWSALLTAIICGSVIGIERQLRGKPVGIRTSTLIVLGTYIFIEISQSVQTDMTDPSRILGQVVTGIGFLGAGVMLTREGTVMGVTSAATIWSLAAIGAVIALGDSLVAVKLSILVVLILFGVDFLENSFTVLTQGVHKKYLDFRKGNSTDEVQ